MNAIVYWFSGTGNSLAAARAVAARTGASLVPIASLDGETAVRPDAGVIGIVFPVYYARLPLIVERFAAKLDGISGTYVFAIATYGHGGSRPLNDLARIIRSRGGVLAARYGMHLPQNAFHKPWENRRRLFARMERTAAAVARRTAQGGKKRFLAFSSYLLRFFEIPLQSTVHFLVEKSMRAVTGLPPGSGRERLWPALDKGFSVSVECDGCGLCARICPVQNVRLENGRPVWLHRCENCLACYNWCPQRAIRGWIAKNDYHYRHPEMTAGDFIAAAKLR